MKARGIAALAVVALLAASVTLTGFVRYNGIGNVYYSTDMEIFEGVRFSRILAGHDTNGVERAYVVTADTVGSPIRPVVFTGESSGKYTPDAMAATLEAQGYKVVAGINGDVFSTDSGCPMGLTIHEGKIQSSGYAPGFAIAFDDAGKASLAWTNMRYGLRTEVFAPQPDGSVPATPYTAPIGYVNVPHGAGKSLHLFNRAYGPSTKTPKDTVEVVLRANTPDEAQIRIGVPVLATVTEVRLSGGDTPMGDDTLVLSGASDSEAAWYLRMMAPGSAVEINASEVERGAISNSVECLGMYYLLYDHGNWVTAGTNLNPRTIMGIKQDGSIMLYVLDGRQPGISAGLGLTDAARHLVDLGCVVVANLDGGGSSAMLVREPGLDTTAVLKNAPSEGAQRRVTNGFFLVYRDVSASGARKLSTYPNYHLAMPGARVQLTSYFTNALYEKQGGAATGLRYEITEGGGSVSETGVFTAAESKGRSVIKISGDGAETQVTINVYDQVTITPGQTEVFLNPGESTDINVTATYGYAPIAHSDDLFTWTCDELVGSVDGNGVFRAAPRSGVTGEIKVSFGNASARIPVLVGAKITFSDLVDPVTNTAHWAKDYIESLANRGVINGMGDDRFAPDAPLTRAQFLAILARTERTLDLNSAAPSGFEDVPENEWYYRYVNWGFEAGIVQGVDDTRFLPDAGVTREQMAVMANNFTARRGATLPETAQSADFADAAAVSEWATAATERMVRAGILNGLPDGRFDPKAGTTRAQAAKVVFLLEAASGA